MLATHIAFSRNDAPPKTLVFTSPFTGDSKATTVVNLGLSFAQRGQGTADRPPMCGGACCIRSLEVPLESRLPEVLKGTSSFESARRVVFNDIDLDQDAVYDSTYKYVRGYEHNTSDH